jgi:hypothetical protein
MQIETDTLSQHSFDHPLPTEGISFTDPASRRHHSAIVSQNNLGRDDCEP